ncbi:MAG: hypothetical protein HY591_00860, partial [Candidatus Omnitrophica bacterium]|nr:hypothetical protein [Candidatus Omnitrophota bacterium]
NLIGQLIKLRDDIIKNDQEREEIIAQRSVLLAKGSIIYIGALHAVPLQKILEERFGIKAEVSSGEDGAMVAGERD